MPTALGHKSYFAFAKEPNYGVFATPTKKVDILSFEVAQQGGIGIDNSLSGVLGPRTTFQPGLYYKGKLSLRVNYEGVEELLRAVLSTYTRTAVSATATYDFVFKPADTLTSLSGEVVLDGQPTGKCWQLTGMKLLNMTIKGKASSGDDARVIVDFDFVSREVTTNATPTNGLSFPSHYPVMFHQALTVDDGTVEGGNVTCTTTTNCSVTTANANMTRTSGVGDFTTEGWLPGMLIICPGVGVGAYVGTVVALTITMVDATGAAKNGTSILTNQTANGYSQIRLRSFEFTVDQPHTEDRFYVGSLLIADPIRSGFPKVTLKLEHDFITRTQFDMFRNMTEGSPQIQFRHGTAFGTSPNTWREFALQMSSAYLRELSVPVDTSGALVSTATWEAIYNDSDAAVCMVRTRNQQAALSA